MRKILWIGIIVTIGVFIFNSAGMIFAADTYLVKDIFPGIANSTPENLTNVNGTLFFRANDDAHGIELWKSDGTPTGTVLVKDIIPGSSGSVPKSLINVNGTLFFTADDGIHGRELWALVPTVQSTNSFILWTK